MPNRKSKKRILSEEEIQKLIDEIEAVENMSDEEYEKWHKERRRKEAEWLLKNNKIKHVATLNRDTFNLISRANWFTDLDFDDFIDYGARQFAIKVLKANGCDPLPVAMGGISVVESKMGFLGFNEDEKLDDDTVYSYLGILDHTEGGKSVVMIPDLNVAAYGDNDKEAFDAAEQVLTSTLYSLKATNCPLPNPTDHTAELDRCKGWGFVYSLPLSIYQTLDELRRGTMRTYSLEEVIRSLGLDG